MKKVLYLLLLAITILGCKKGSSPAETTGELEGYTLTSANTTDTLERITLQKKVDLSNSKIDYFTPGSDREPVIDKGAALNEGDTIFQIVDYGPENELPSEMKKPTIFVSFSLPVVPLAKLGEIITTTDIMKIEPPTAGVFRYYGTSVLSFEPDAPLTPRTLYTITIADNVKSLGGKLIDKGLSFTFSTEKLKMINCSPNGDEIPLDDAKKILVTFNYPVEPALIKEHIGIYTGEKRHKIDVSNYEKDKTGKTVFITVQDSFNENEEVNLYLDEILKTSNGYKKDGDKTEYRIFKTISPFTYKGLDTYDENFVSKGDTNPVVLKFSHPIDDKTLSENITTSLDVKNMKDHIFVWENVVTLRNLPVIYNSQYKITVKPGIKDIYGRTLTKGGEENIAVKNAASFYYFPNSGVKILESSYKPQIIYEMQNLKRGKWKIGKIDYPYDFYDEYELYDYDMSHLKENTKHFEILDLTKYLNSSGKGFVGISWNFDQGELPYELSQNDYNDFINYNNAELINILKRGYNFNTRNHKYYYDYNLTYEDKQRLLALLKNEGYGTPYSKYRQENLNLQVTNLGATVRYAYNKVAVMVATLSDSSTVTNAKVTLKNENKTVTSKVTNKDGLAVFDFKDGEFVDKFYKQSNSNYKSLELIVKIEHGDDKIEFRPDDCGHNPYHFSVYPESISSIDTTQNTTMLFTDRGLYKPGETVTFRGIDKNLKLGKYSNYTGEYSISVIDYNNKNSKLVFIEGKTTTSGGFHGSFALPEDIAPGYYTIEYKRDTDKYPYCRESFQVANFKRLNFFVKMTPPKIAIYKNDDISVGVCAGYLSGGSLSGADYEYYCFRESTPFRPEGTKWDQFVFGTDDYQPAVTLDTGSGKLGADGSVTIKQSTKGKTTPGVTYRYSLSCEVSDIDRQVVSGNSSVTVHPASYYAGVKFQSNGSYWSRFVKKGDRVNVDFVLVKPDGSLFKGVGKNDKFNIKVVKYDWKMAQQRGVYDRVNTIYDKIEVVESETTLPIEKETGLFTITPKESGEYYLEVSGNDKQGREFATKIYFYATGSDWVKTGASEDITLMPDRNIYKPGETAKIMVQSPLSEGKYLLTLEREGIISEKVIELKGCANIIDIPVDETMIPVFYASICSYSKRDTPPSTSYGEPDLGKPKGYFGICKILVDTQPKTIDLEIYSSKPSYLPGEEAEFIVRATKDNKPVQGAEITFLAVDRGVIDLINYHIPDPIKFFYDEWRFPIGVHGADSRSLLIDPVTYEMKDLYGGDGTGNAADSKMKQRKDFSPTAVFKPSLITDASGLTKIKFKFPDTLTTYRCTAFAVKDTNFGLKESEMIVQNPINVRTAIPRKLRIRDTAFAGVIITNLDKSPHSIKVTFDSDIVEVDGQKEITINMKPSSIVEVPFKILAVKSGNGKIEITTKSELLNEKLTEDFAVEQPTVKETFTTMGNTDDFKEESLVIPSNIAKGYGSIDVKLDSSKFSLLKEAIEYLWNYPHPCLEQRSSRLLPAVLFKERINDITGIKNIVPTIEKEIAEWAKYQNPDGGFPLWLENGERSVYFVSLKIAKFIYYAKLSSIKIPDSLDVKALLDYISRENDKYSYSEAYSLFVLSLHGRDITVKADNLLKTKGDKLGTGGLCLIGMAFLNNKNIDSAKMCYDKVKNLISIGTNSIDFTETDEHYYFDSYTTRLALLLSFYHRMNATADKNMETKIVNTIISAQKAGYWENTYSTGWIVEAFYEVYEKGNGVLPQFTGKVTLDKKELISSNFDADKKSSISKSFEFEDKLKGFPRDKTMPLRFEKSGKGTMFYSASIKYSLPAEVVTQRDEGFSVFAEMFDMDGNKITGNALTNGKTYRMKVKIGSSKRRQFVAVSIPIPSGAEILDTTFATTGVNYKIKDNQSDYEDYDWFDYEREPVCTIYDNEIRYFYDNFKSGQKEIEFVLRTTSAGIFPTPPITASCMYEEEVFGRNYGSLYEIKDEK